MLCHVNGLLLQVPPVVLEWDDLNCHWTGKKKKQQKNGKGKGKGAAEASSSSSSSGTKQILHNLTGQASPGR